MKKNHLLQTHLKKVIGCCLAALTGIALFSAAMDTSNAGSWFAKNIPAFWSIFGFLAATIIIIIAHLAAKAGLQVPEDFYERAVLNGKEEE
ncbi:MAG: hypothetical protein CSA33_00635 [Desulfobulbus propionicus]|nr:MAG: hypothetical protein CSA33_00635 [Desulfobulbus propionicus]